MAGYSGTPLAKKLGSKAGHRLLLVDEPPDFERSLAPLPKVTRAPDNTADVIVAFHTARRALERDLPALKRRLDPAGALGVAWPKKASGAATDITEDVVRALALANGLVDNKVCAIDETWSGPASWSAWSIVPSR
jgi:hypothetical protein